MLNPTKPTTAVKVVAAVIQRQDKTLITLRPADKKLGGFWEFPGGKIEAGESQQIALIREIKEELDIDITVGKLIETVHHRYEWGNVIIYAYLCKWKSGTIKHLEVADHCWVKPDKLLLYDILEADKPIVLKLQGFTTDAQRHG